ncbi:MAG: glycosyltransferase family 2 protein [Gemmatimonas sp.]
MTHLQPPSPTTSGAVDSGPRALTVIVPAFNCPVVLQSCFDGLLASDLPRARWELIVVDDSSSDHTPDVARTVADRVLITERGPRGPGEARNLGAAAASAPILLFIDSDVVVLPTTLSGFVRAFADRPEIDAVFGSYDDLPTHGSFVSQYRNLLHHYVHQEDAGDAATFWAGCGAVRRSAFQAVGGYDGARYPRPQIEDIELGYRLRDAGHQILLAPELQCRHLKQWTFGNMVRTDLRDRAIPWMRLLIDRREAVSHGPLNLQSKEKLLTVACAMAMMSLLLAIVTTSVGWAVVSLTGVALVILGNLSLFRWFSQQRGVLFALRVVPMRLLYYMICGMGAGWAILTQRSHRAPANISPRHDRRDPVAAS